MFKGLARAILTCLLIATSTYSHANKDLLGTLQQSQSVDFLPVEEAYQYQLAQTTQSLNVEFTIAPQYYLYRHRFSVTDHQGKTISFDQDAGLPKHDEFFGDVEVFYQFTELKIPLAALSTEHPQQLNVTFQGCADAGLCYPPETINTLWNPSDGSFTLGSLTTTNSYESAQTDDDTSWWMAVLLAIVGGAVLNLMPCVFPVLSLKALSLLQRHERHPIYHGLSYTAGILISFVGIAALMLSLRSAGAGIGWGFQLQSTLFVASLCYIFFILALNLSGQFEFAFRFSGAGQSFTEGHGLSASFATGVLAALVASPCTAPFMGTALAYAITQPPIIALSIFAALGLGLGLPFLLITAMPKLADKLPAPGAWMQTLRELLAFPLYLTCIWLLWVINHQSNSSAVALIMVGGVAIALGIWLWGATLWRRIIALVCFGAAIAILLSPQLNRPIDSNNAVEFQERQIDEALAAGHPVFVNITADWCITCLVNERNALGSDNIEKLFADKGIVYIKGDWTRPSPAINNYLNKHNRSGVPLYVVYYRNQIKILPQILSERLVIEAFEG